MSVYDSPSFDALPTMVSDYVNHRLMKILTNKDDSGEFDKTIERLRETLGGYADTIATSPSTTIEPESRASTRRHMELFEELWRYSEEDPNLRSLRI